MLHLAYRRPDRRRPAFDVISVELVTRRRPQLRWNWQVVDGRLVSRVVRLLDEADTQEARAA